MAQIMGDQVHIWILTGWMKINGSDSALIRASLITEDTTHYCIGTVVAKRECWSFLKGGFVLTAPSNLSTIYFQNTDDREISIAITSASLQPFTEQQWSLNQQYRINKERKRAVTIHVSDRQGGRLQGVTVTVEQVSKDFPFGSAIAKTIIGNLPYQVTMVLGQTTSLYIQDYENWTSIKEKHKLMEFPSILLQNWFVNRFNAAVFENELKWYITEPKPGQLNYALADQMLEFVRSNQIIARGHNIFWEDPRYIPSWVLDFTGSELQSAVNARIQSLMSKYKDEFIHWDVSNEMLHFDFYEERLGLNATLHFYEMAHQADPLATLFMNEFNVVETCSDIDSTVDNYISRLKELKRGGVSMDGIGLESHFSVPNRPLMRAILDKLATLELPIWLTEVDVSHTLNKETQAFYLEQVLREGFSHPSVKGIMLWTALHPYGCYEMCLTDNDFNNLPAGDMVDKLLQEWQTGYMKGETDERGSYSFYGFLGEYKVTAKYGNRTTNSTFSLNRAMYYTLRKVVEYESVRNYARQYLDKPLQRQQTCMS
ncbi:hypothetical protein LguiA_009105 [Lonicera macranthoides]